MGTSLPTVSLTTLGSPGGKCALWFKATTHKHPTSHRNTQTLMCSLPSSPTEKHLSQSRGLKKSRQPHSEISFQGLFGGVPLIRSAGVSPSHPRLFPSAHPCLSHMLSHPPPPLTHKPGSSLLQDPAHAEGLPQAHVGRASGIKQVFPPLRFFNDNSGFLKRRPTHHTGPQELPNPVPD